MMFKLRPIFWPTSIMLPIVVFALGLSVWQMERREWKLGILNRIAENQAAAPLTLDELIKGDPLRCEYGRVASPARCSTTRNTISPRAA